MKEVATTTWFAGKKSRKTAEGESLFRSFLANGIVALAFVVLAFVSHAVTGSQYGCVVIWLPAGLALAVFLGGEGRRWPGLVVGAAVSYFLVLEFYGLLVGKGPSVLAIGVGVMASVAGPWMGACLVRRRSDWPSGLASERGGLVFYLLGGLGGGLFGGILLTATWVSIGLVPTGVGWFFLVQQTLALVLGMVAITPLLLLLSVLPLEPWSGQAGPRKLPFLIAILAVLALLAFVSRSAIRDRAADFQEMTTKESADLNRLLVANEESLESIRSLWDSSDEVEEGEFRIFVSRSLRQNQGMEWLAWLPEIDAGDRERWNTWAREEGIPVLEPGIGEGEFVEGRAYPVLYVEPSPEEGLGNRGFNLASVREIDEIISRGRGRSAPLATPLFLILGQPRIAILQWIDGPEAGERGAAQGGELQWIRKRSGFALAILDVRALLEKSVEEAGELPIGIRLVEPGREPVGGGTWQGLVEHRWSEERAGLFPREEAERPIQVAGRTWWLQARAIHPLMIGRLPWEIAGAQVISGVLVVLLGMLLMAAAGRTSRIEREVVKRTAELIEAQERFAQLADNIDEGFWISDPGGKRLLFLSKGGERIWGKSLQGFRETTGAWRNSIHPDDRAMAFETFGQPDPEKGFDIEYRIVREDGTIRWIRDRGFPVRNEQGDIVRMAGVSDDTTDLKVSEARLRRAMEEAREASELLEQFFKVSIDLLCVAGMDGYFKRINPAFMETLGYTQEELLKRPFIEFVHADDVAGTYAAMEHLSEGESLIRFQNRYRNGSGKYLWLEWSAVPDPDGELIYAAARDVTAQKEMEMDLQRSNAELEQFAYLASHDLQEPLRVVTSFVQLLQRRYQGRLDDDADEYIRHAVGGAERMRKLILGLLELSRVERKGRPLEITDSAEVLEEALQNLAIAIEESGAEIVIGELPRILADREQIVRLFQNLVGNAIKFCGGGPPKVQISARREGDMASFVVEDNGPGIPETQRERAFQIFQRLGSETEVSGTGIGLAICRRIVERHGGSIGIEEASSGGAAFHFRLPLVN
ncbi:MAG: PAS domain-containing protein [Verrucomicrobiae bacterium]|nr:PAS domain-containing protein [Verrucomicrobiae bacterium]